MKEKKISNFDFLEIEKNKSTVEIVINKIKELLLSKKLLPGDKLPNEFILAENFSISRGSIREAMKILSAFGIIEIRRGDGTYISKLDKKVPFDPLLFSLIINYKNFNELFELRESLELSVVKLIIKNAKTEELKRIEKALLEMEKGSLNNKADYRIMAEYDINFHIALGKATNNSLLDKIYSFVLDLFKDSIEATHKNQDHASKAIALHKNIYNSLIEKDINKAVKAIEESMGQWENLHTNKDKVSRNPKNSIISNK